MMSINAELTTKKDRNMLPRTDKKVIAIVQLTVFVVLLFLIDYSKLYFAGYSSEINGDALRNFLINMMIIKPLALFLGTVLLIKGIQLLYKRKSGEIGFKKLRNILFAISLLVIALFAGCVIYILMLSDANDFSKVFFMSLNTVNASKYILASKIYLITLNYNVILATITGILFMARSA